jgi:hypothetical protein
MKHNFGSYTVIYGNMIYTVKDVYMTTVKDRRIFCKTYEDSTSNYKDLILSVPAAGSIAIKNGEGVTMSVNSDIQAPNITETTTVNKVVNNENDSSNEVGAFALGAIAGGILF